jgi:hypothetical protein
MIHPEIVEFIKLFNVNRYLEIGFGDGVNFIEMPVDYKVCISPIHPQEPQFNLINRVSDRIKFYNDKSEIVFETFKEDPFDLIFIDGMHEYTHVIDDIYSCLNFLNPNGIIIVHDVNPINKPDYMSNKLETPGLEWCGDVWKSVIHVASEFLNLNYHVIYDKDWPGFMVLTKMKDNQKRTNPVPDIEYKYINPNLPMISKYPYNNLQIEFARNNKNLFNYKTLDESLQILKEELK